MSAAQLVDFKRTGRKGSLRPGGSRESLIFYISVFDEMNRRNEQPTTVNIIFSSPLTISIIKHHKINEKKLT